MSEKQQDARQEPGHSRENVKLRPIRETTDEADKSRPVGHPRPGGPEPQADGAGT